ncbi:hypothetical protein SAMN04487881_3811 [Marinobacter sp. es.048]|uniref:hypothetical protein n=2 Tax=Marinobacter sp. es.048 TaxID=1761795 RepID=UPI000B592C49|nr:hypothetical protein [Marinobacter sp. es.048]SNC77138.1 hypothetical protein SAMN04487881_3811 [Marinobacter sp. es.048]
MTNSEPTSPHPLRKPLLIAEFTALAILLASMGWFSSQTTDGQTINAGWLLIPAFASLGVFISFIGLMYLRWVASAESGNRFKHKVIFSLLAVTLIGVWIYGIANTWFSLTAS